MKIQVLIENTYCNESLFKTNKLIDTQREMVCEHGLSIFITYNDMKILLDAGSTSAFINNAILMGADIGNANYCVLSHGHYDHSGGFAEYIKNYPDKKIYGMKSITCDYYSGSGGIIHPIGVPKDVYPQYENNFVLIDKSIELAKGIHLVTHKMSNTYSNIGKRAKLYKKMQGKYIPDDFSHELSLVFESDNGLVVFNSCSHIGIINIINEINEYFGSDKKIKAFIGGLHMQGKINDKPICTFSENEVKDMAIYLDEKGVEKLYTCHCTGTVGYEMLKKYMKDKVEYISTGVTIELI